jgi:hypothetical protein
VLAVAIRVSPEVNVVPPSVEYDNTMFWMPLFVLLSAAVPPVPLSLLFQRAIPLSVKDPPGLNAKFASPLGDAGISPVSRTREMVEVE